MTVTDTTAPSQKDSLSFELDLAHAPEKVWRALADPALLAEWLLPAIGLELAPGAEFTLKTQAYPGWDGTVSCRSAVGRRGGSDKGPFRQPLQLVRTIRRAASAKRTRSSTRCASRK